MSASGWEPSLGGTRRQRNPRLWRMLLHRAIRKREQAVARLQERGLSDDYVDWLIEELPTLTPLNRAFASESLSLLGDPRFSLPHFLPEMLPIPGGNVLLGSNRFSNERPVHTVTINPFSLARYPVTNAAYSVFVQDTGHRVPRTWKQDKPHPELLNAPVVWISARDAEAYCRWLSKQTSESFRLPTEPEWMMAARGFGRGLFPWEGEFDESRANIWTRRSAQRLCMVGAFPAGRGPFGHDDLCGNVWEWTSSLYWPYPYNPLDGREDITSSQSRLMLGGSWRSQLDSARCTTRQGDPPGDSFEVVGFRLARDI